jgi:hypothetical protein
MVGRMTAGNGGGSGVRVRRDAEPGGQAEGASATAGGAVAGGWK